MTFRRNVRIFEICARSSMDRALASEAKGYGFDPRRAHSGHKVLENRTSCMALRCASNTIAMFRK